MRKLVLGLGNPILTDDGVGIHVVRAVAAFVREAQADAPKMDASQPDVVEASVGGLRLLDLLVGYQRVVMVDAIQTRSGHPGDIHHLSPNDLRTMHSGSTHDLSLSGALALGRGLGMDLPRDDAFAILAVEVEDVLTFGEVCTPAVVDAIPRVVEMVLREIAPGESERTQAS